MSSKKSNHSEKSKQPFLYIINTINQGFELSKYENDLKQYSPIISFIFQFYSDDIKAFFAFNKEISREKLCNILEVQDIDQIIQIQQITKGYENFPNKIIICPIPQCFYKPKDSTKSFLFEEFLKNVSQNNSFNSTYRYDHRIINSQNRYSSAILYQFFNNIKLKSCSPKAFCSKPYLLPIVSVSNIPIDFDSKTLVDTFQCHLKEKVITYADEKPLQNNEKFYSIRFTFENFDIAQRAVEMFNFSRLDDVEIEVHIFIPFDEDIKEMKEWKLIIDGIPEDLSSLQLYRAFSRFGKIYKAFVKKTPDSPPYGVVQYFDKNDAKNVIEKVDQATLNGCTINVFHKIKIRINNFSSITKEEVQSNFSSFNPFSIKIIENEKSRPTVFLTFRTESEASEVIEIASKMNSFGMKLLADYESSKNYDYSEEKSLFLSGLPPNYTQIQLIDLCKVYGLLSNAKVTFNKETQKSYGNVEYDSPESAKTALEKMGGLAIEGEPVKVSPFKPKTKGSKY